MKWSAEPKRGRGKASTRRNSGLGPQARGIFDRLFGSSAPKENKLISRAEAVSVAIASGKGGTGKSFVATNLSIFLHHQGKSITLVDCDFGLACDHLLLGVSPKLTLQHLVTGKANVRDVRIRTPAGPSLVPGASGVRRMADLADQELLTFGHALGDLAALEDVLIFDVGAGIAPQNVMTLLAVDHIVLVTEPEIAALTDAYAVIKCVATLMENAVFSVIVNRVARRGQGMRTFDKLAEVAKRYTGVKLYYLGEIESDPTVTQHRLGQLPLAVTDPKGPTSQALKEILANLEKHAGPFEKRSVQSSNSLEARFREHRLFLT